jgi:selenophosphate synthetase-related protein
LKNKKQKTKKKKNPTEQLARLVSDSKYISNPGVVANA